MPSILQVAGLASLTTAAFLGSLIAGFAVLGVGLLALGVTLEREALKKAKR